MPIYKVYGARGEDRRSRRSLARMRWAAVLLSAVLLLTAALMLWHTQ